LKQQVKTHQVRGWSAFPGWIQPGQTPDSVVPYMTPLKTVFLEPRNPYPMNSSNKTIAGKTLKQLVDRLVNDSLHQTCSGKNSIVNEMTDNMCIYVDELKEGVFISQLLATVVTNARNGDIHISAGQFRDIITLEIEDRNNYNGYALAAGLQSIEPEANRLGGSLSIMGAQKLVAKVSFSFPLLTVQGNLPPHYFQTRYYC